MKNSCMVYKIVCVCNGKCYIGMTSRSMYQRFYEHSREATANHRNRKKKRDAFHSDMKQMGLRNFKFTVLHAGLSKNEALIKEAVEIINHGSLIPNGYNISSGRKISELANI